MGLPLLFQSPFFECYDTEKMDGTYYQCTELEACKNQEYFEKNNIKEKNPFIVDKEISPHSLVIDFELYCDRKYLIGMCGSSFFIGAVLAGLIFPKMAE